MARASLIPSESSQTVSSTRSRYSTGGFELSSKESSGCSSANSQQHQQASGSTPEIVDTLRHQNRLLARRNAMIMSKLKELELENVELSKQINSLKRTTTPPPTKQAFHETLSIIENKTFSSFNELLSCFQKIRSDEGLPVNDQLGILSDVISRPITSTPVEVGRNGMGTFPAFDITSHDPLLNYFKPKEDEEVTTSSNNNKYKDISIIFEDNESIEMASESTDLNIVEPEHNLLKERQLNSEQPEKVVPKLKSPCEIKKDIQEENHEENVNSSKSEKPSSTRKPKKVKSTKLKSQEIQQQQQEEATEKESVVTTTTKATTKVTASKNKSSKSDFQPLIEVKVEAENDGATRRSRRSRKPIDYKPLSMRDKMRRESVAMVDAVGPDVLINYTQKPVSRGSSAGSSSSKRKSQTPEVAERKKRKPLTELTTNKGATTKLGKDSINEQNHYDLSVYDFEPEEKKSTPVYDKINLKNRARG
ncbi:hypothetical protein JA1_004617 [Spathaspora sp. JA1]|nr:hypothetical protein JA1_004617 [Spathaspora sp. JA1]